MNYSVQDLLFYFLKHFTNSLSSEYGSFRVEFEFADIFSLPSSHVATYFFPQITTPLPPSCVHGRPSRNSSLEDWAKFCLVLGKLANHHGGRNRKSSSFLFASL